MKGGEKMNELEISSMDFKIDFTKPNLKGKENTKNIYGSLSKNFTNHFEKAKSIIDKSANKEKIACKPNKAGKKLNDKISKEEISKGVGKERKNRELDKEIQAVLQNLNIFLENINSYLGKFKVNLNDEKELGDLIELLEIQINLLETLSEDIIKGYSNGEESAKNIDSTEILLNNLSKFKETMAELNRTWNDYSKNKIEFNFSNVEEVGEKIRDIYEEIALNIGEEVKKDGMGWTEKLNIADDGIERNLKTNKEDLFKELEYYESSRIEMKDRLEEKLIVKNNTDTDIEEESIVPKNIEEEKNDLDWSEGRDVYVDSDRDLTFDPDIESIENTPVEIPKEKVIKQIVDKAKLMFDKDKSEIRIKLKPEILGELLLKVEIEKGVVVAKAIVDNYRTKELIETNMYQLKEDLENQDLDIKTFEVQVGSDADFEKEGKDEMFQNKNNKRRRLKKDSISNLNNYEENIISNSLVPVGESGLDLKA